MTAQASCVENWNGESRLANYKITCSKIETILTKQRPVIQFQLFERMDIVHPLLTRNGEIAASVLSSRVNRCRLLQCATRKMCLRIVFDRITKTSVQDGCSQNNELRASSDEQTLLYVLFSLFRGQCMSWMTVANRKLLEGLDAESW